MRLDLSIAYKYILIAILGMTLSVPAAISANEGGGHGEEHKSGSAQYMIHDQDLMRREIKRHFHNSESELINPIIPPAGVSNEKSLCIYCPGSFPHINNRVVRAMFNFHKIFIACETCHYKKRFDANVGYRWYDGTERTIRDLKHLESKNTVVEVGPKKRLMDKDVYEKYGFKISPYVKKDGKLTMMVALESDPFSQKFKELQGKLSADQQGRMKAKIHGEIDPLGSDCIDCHKQNSQLPFKALGFTETRIKDLVQTEAAGLFKYYSRDPKYKGMTFKIRRLSGIWGIDFKK